MKSLKLMLGAVLVSGLVLAGAATPVMATEATQEQSQELKVKCSVGSYGQDTTCEAEGKQEQKQTIKVLGKTHYVVDTALDLQTTLAAGGMMLTSAGAFVLKRKINS